jgi:L-malate glycosyltransferase
MKKKVLHIISSTHWRGGEQQVQYLLQAESTAFEYCLFCPENAELLKRNSLKQGQLFSYKKRFGVDISAAVTLKKLCAQHQIDLLHIHDTHSLHTFWLADLLGMHLPAVLQRHVNFPVFSKWKYKHPRIKKIICVSDVIRQRFSRFIEDKKLELIYPGIDIEKFSKQIPVNNLRKEINIGEKGRIIGMVAALEKEKNIDEFLEIAYRYSKQNTEDQFVLIGDGSLLQTYKTQYNLSNLYFMGFRHNIEALLPSFDVFLFTSKNEGFGQVLLEAMAAKVPIICANFPAANEIIQHGKTGFIYKDVNDALQLIENLLTSHDLEINTTENAFHFVQQFDVTLMNEKIEGVYQTVLKND